MEESSRITRPVVYNTALGYLRMFATVLVLAHHAVLAYHPFAPPQATSLTAGDRWWQAFPISDPDRSQLIGMFVGWNDIVLMALLFLVSGIFVTSSLDRRGVQSFLTGRLVRLGIPFLVVAYFVAPLAYLPTYFKTASPLGIGGYVDELLLQPNWPAGPAWFLWMLLAFGAIAGGVYAIDKDWTRRLNQSLSRIIANPLLSFALLVILSGLVYMPMALAVHPGEWVGFGPIAYQTSRQFFYASYFLFGIVIGANGLSDGLLDRDGGLARYWVLWVTAAAASYMLVENVQVGDSASLGRTSLANFAFVVCCATSSLAVIAIFVRLVETARPVLDSMSRNAYGMYLVHYPIASWGQYAILDVDLGALPKAAIVVTATVLLSWATTAALRSIPLVRRAI